MTRARQMSHHIITSNRMRRVGGARPTTRIFEELRHVVQLESRVSSHTGESNHVVIPVVNFDGEFTEWVIHYSHVVHRKHITFNLPNKKYKSLITDGIDEWHNNTLSSVLLYMMFSKLLHLLYKQIIKIHFGIHNYKLILWPWLSDFNFSLYMM